MHSASFPFESPDRDYIVGTTHSSALTKLIQMVVPSSVSDSASIFRKHWWWEAFESGYILKQLRESQLISPGVYSRTVDDRHYSAQDSTQIHVCASIPI